MSKNLFYKWLEELAEKENAKKELGLGSPKNCNTCFIQVLPKIEGTDWRYAYGNEAADGDDDILSFCYNGKATELATKILEEIGECSANEFVEFVTNTDIFGPENPFYDTNKFVEAIGKDTLPDRDIINFILLYGRWSENATKYDYNYYTNTFGDFKPWSCGDKKAFKDFHVVFLECCNSPEEKNLVNRVFETLNKINTYYQ